MKKRVMALIVAIVMLMSAAVVFAEEENTEISVYLTVSKYGEIVKSKNGDFMVCAEILLSGQPSYTIDDAFKNAHELYFEEGAEGYATSVSEWGLGVDKIWGDTSGNFGYQVNGAKETVLGPGHILKNGDHIEAVIYKNLYPDTESYSKFDKLSVSITEGEFTKLQLLESGYDDSWNMVFSPCKDAVITIDGAETDYITDENGIADISFSEEGKYIISAKKEKVLNEVSVPAICAPVCVVEVIKEADFEIIHNIAKMFSETDLTADKGNLPWILADMAMYEELYPESDNILTDKQKKEYLKYISENAKDMEKPGDLAKTILAIRALSHDAERIFLKDYKKVNLVSKLCEMVDEKDERVTNIYTLPYVIIALTQSEEYMSEKQRDKLISAAVESKDAWISTEFGTDALTPMVLALAHFYNENEDVKAVIDEAIEVLKSQQREDGLIDGFEGYESASTGLALCAFSAMGIDSNEIICGENSLIEGLMSTANDDKSAFSNAFATEQGFRGLLAWRLLCDNKGKSIYDFSDYKMHEINLSPAKYCPVIFDISPKGASLTINGGEEIEENCYDLSEGTYTYTVSKSGYTQKSGTVEISEKDAENHIVKNIDISLSRKKSSGGSDGGGISSGGGISVTPVVKEEKQEEIKEENKVFSDNIFADVKDDDWFYNSVKYVYENNLFSGTDKGFEPYQNMTRAMLVTVLYRFATPDLKVSSANPFADVESGSWYEESVKWALKENIVSGISDTLFAPDRNITREQIATIFYRFAKQKGLDVLVDDENILPYNDANLISSYALEAMRYAVEKGIITGKSEKILAPSDFATRAEVATMIMRFAKVVVKSE